MTREPLTDEGAPSKLVTERLVLRPLSSDDVEPVHALLSDERVVKYMLFPRFSRERAQHFIQKLQKPHELNPPQIVFGIVEAEGKERTKGVVGLCGLVLEPDGQHAEVWYLLRPALWGKGLVTEAVEALVSHGFEALELHRIWASCLPENPASARVLEKLGFRREGLMRKNLRIHGEWRDSYLYAVLAEEWDR